MKQKHTKILTALIAVSLLIMPVKAHALITATGNSSDGVITALASILIPIPIVNLSITETGPPTDFFGFAQLKISEHDDENKYNSLQITMGSDAPFEIPIPYGSFGLSYLMAPGWPAIGIEGSDLYAYLSVAYGSVIAKVGSNVDITLSFEKEELLELLKIFLPDAEGLGLLIGEGPFNIDISLTGGIEGIATEANPTISGGAFNFSLTLPEDLIDIGIPLEIPNEFEGSLAIDASFEWVPFELFSSVSLSPTLTLNGEESQLDPITFDLLPSGTFIFYLDQD
ncbi:MAG: hypothetical protein JRJ00_10850 [Deltaproteobacteria bacterium]|nr:hypothetical protein [Deltaproteobacteria bacterium]